MTKIQISGGIMERLDITRKSPLLRRMWNIVHYDGQNLIIVIVGDSGVGKSYTALRLGEIFDEEFRNIKTDEEADKLLEERVLNKPSDFSKIIAEEEKKLKFGSVVMIDDAGIAMPVEKWQADTSVVLSKIFQTFRTKHIILILTIPNLKFLGIRGRQNLRYLFDVLKIDKKKKQNISKVKEYQVNKETGDIYRKNCRFYSNNTKVKLNLFITNKPGKILADRYEIRANEFKAAVAQEAHAKLKDAEEKRSKTQDKKKQFDVDKTVNSVMEAFRKGDIPTPTTHVIEHYFKLKSLESRVTMSRIRQLKLLSKYKHTRSP